MKQKLNCILLIDDDEPTNFLNSMVIEEVDCAERVETMQNAREALKYLTNASPNGNYPRPDLVFLDINMPAMDGWEFLEKYHQLPEEQQAKIIMVMLTTSFNPEDELKARGIAGIAGFWNKPLTAEILKHILQKHFPDKF
jgi:CheY-like chemotaxis protein